MKRYDYLIVGSGLYGAVFAQQAQKKGKKVLVIDKRPNIAGNVYTEDIEKHVLSHNTSFFFLIFDSYTYGSDYLYMF